MEEPVSASIRAPQAISLAEQEVSAAQRRNAVIACLAYALLVAVLVPFATRPLPPMPQVTGVFATAVLVADLCTLILLAAQFQAGGARWLVILYCAYLYSGLMALLHLLTFPGAFIDGAPVVGTAQTVALLYMSWGVGFVAILLIAVVSAARSPDLAIEPERRTRALALATAGILGVAGALLAVGTIAIPLLPAFMSGDRFAPWTIAMQGVRAALAIAALWVLWMKSSGRSAILVWLALVLVAAAAGPLLTDLGARRYTFGWYAGRASFVFASYVLLAVLLTEFVKLQKVLAEAVERLERQSTSLNEEMKRRELAETRLVQGQRMEAIGHLAGGMAHDFNNLLTAVTGNLEMILRTASDERLRRLAQQARDAALRSARLTHSLLAFGRRQPLLPRPVRVRQLLDEFRSLLQRAVGAAVQVHIDCEAGVWPCRADPTHLELALLNLALNARDAMPKGGPLNIECRNASFASESGIPSGTELAPGDYVAVSVSDRGVGVPSGYRDKVFEPFFTTKEAGKGTGLGLSQVQGFAKQSGGDVALETAEGVGTTVTIYLPRAASDDDSIERREAYSQPGSGRGDSAHLHG